MGTERIPKPVVGRHNHWPMGSIPQAADLAGHLSADEPAIFRWRPGFDGGAAFLAAAIFPLLSSLAAVGSKAFIEDDACTHYIYARFALTEYHYLTNVWGRPFCTGIYAIPAYLGGRLGVRLMSLVLALSIAWMTMLIAKRQG